MKLLPLLRSSFQFKFRKSKQLLTKSRQNGLIFVRHLVSNNEPDTNRCSTMFKYTQSNLNLSPQQREFYEVNGYILIPNLINHRSIDKFTQRFVDLCNGKNDAVVFTLMKDQSLKKTGAKGEFVVNKIQDFIFDDVFFEYCQDPNVLKVVSDIIGPDVIATHTMLINKPPNANPELSLHPLHQDLYYFPFRPAERIVAAWTAMEKVNEENGCLYVVPGSHKGELYRHTYPEGTKNKLYHGIYGMDHLPKVNVVMEKGDTVFFHPLLLHGSGPNKSKNFRKAISCHFASGQCYFIDVKGTVQEEIANEILEIAKKKNMEAPNFKTVWQLKSRLVQGNSGTFLNAPSHL